MNVERVMPPNIEALREYQAEVRNATRAYIQGSGDDDFDRQIAFPGRQWSMSVAQLLAGVSGGGYGPNSGFLLTHPLPAADAGVGFCADGICMSAQTQQRTIFQGGNHKKHRDVANYNGKKWDPDNCSGPSDKQTLGIWASVRWSEVARQLLSDASMRRAAAYVGEFLGVPGSRLDSLLDPAPLRRTLRERVDFDQLDENVRAESIAAAAGWQVPPVDPQALAAIWVKELDRHGVQRAALIASIPGDENSVAEAVRAFMPRFASKMTERKFISARWTTRKYIGD